MGEMAMYKLFRVSLVAEVTSTWREKFGPDETEDPNHLTMSLKIPTWPESDILLARIRTPGEEPLSMIEGKVYDIHGRLYFKPQKQYLYITWQQERPEVSDAQTQEASGTQAQEVSNAQAQEVSSAQAQAVSDPQAQEADYPSFQVICNVTGVIGNNRIGLIWGAWDEYRGAFFRQYVSTTCPFAKEEVEQDVDKLWTIVGTMAGKTDLRITRMQSIDPSE